VTIVGKPADRIVADRLAKTAQFLEVPDQSLWIKAGV
jgi:hypothetical protein